MLKYNPKDWFGLIFEFHKSDTLRKLMYVLILFGAYAVAIVYLELHYTDLKSTITIHSLLGFVLGLLLVLEPTQPTIVGGKAEKYLAHWLTHQETWL